MKSYLLVVLLILGAFWMPLSRATHDDDDDESDSPGWVKLRTDGAGPLPRDSIAAWGFDDGIYTFGGFTENLDPNNPRENIFFNDVWRFNVNSRKWRLRSALPDSATNTRPEPRAYSIAGRYGDEFIVGFGITYTADFSSIKAFNDLWGFNTATQRWRRIRADGAADGGPGQRADAAHAIYNGKLYLFGGVTQFFSTKGDTWIFNFATNTWTQPVLTVQPSPRYAPSFALDKVNSRLVLYGGERSEFSESGASFVFAGPDAQWALDFETVTWTQITPRATLSNRNNGNGAVYINDKFFTFGGDIGGGPECSNAIFQQNNVKETWIWDAKINVWTQVCPQNSPPNLKRATSVRVDNDVYMFGGFAFNSTTCGPFEFPTDVWKYSVRGCYGGSPCRN